MRQGAEQSAPTSLPCTITCMIMLITCMIMLIIVNRIQFLYYSSYFYVLMLIYVPYPNNSHARLYVSMLPMSNRPPFIGHAYISVFLTM